MRKISFLIPFLFLALSCATAPEEETVLFQEPAEETAPEPAVPEPAEDIAFEEEEFPNPSLPEIQPEPETISEPMILAEAPAQEKIIIGCAGSFSGSMYLYGRSLKEAVEMVVDRYNAEGRAGDRMIEAVYADDQSRGSGAAISAEYLIERGAVGVVGHTSSVAANQAMRTYSREGIPVISPGADLPLLTQSGRYDNFFRTIAPANERGEDLADYLVNRLRARNVAIIHDSSSSRRLSASETQAAIEDQLVRGSILFDEIDSETENLDDIVRDLVFFDPDAVLFQGDLSTGIHLAGLLKTAGSTSSVLCGDRVIDEDLLENRYLPTLEQNEREYRQIIEEYQARYNREPGPFFLEAYTAALVLCEAVVTSESTNPQTLMQTLRQRTFETPLGRIGFDENGDFYGEE